MGYFGCHLSASGGNAAMVKTALSIDANTIAFFYPKPTGQQGKEGRPCGCCESSCHAGRK